MPHLSTLTKESKLSTSNNRRAFKNKNSEAQVTCASSKDKTLHYTGQTGVGPVLQPALYLKENGVSQKTP
jgi:hypothetical protein